MKIAFLSHNYMDGHCHLDPFRTQLVKEFSTRSSEFLFLQVSDYFDGEGNFNSDASRKLVLNSLQNFKPDAAISINRSGLTPEISSLLNCPVFSWYVDNPFRFPKKFRGCGPTETIYIASKSTYLLDWMRKDIGDPNFQWKYLPFCADTRLFQPSKDPVPDSEKCDVSFVGTLWDPATLIHRINRDVNTEEEKLHLLQGFRRYQTDYSMNLYEYFKDSLSKTYNENDLKSLFDDFISSQVRLNTLRKISDLDVEIYGNATWTGYALFNSPELLKCFRRTPVDSPDALAKLYRRTRVGLSIAHHQAQSGFPIRIMDIFATGTPLVTDRHSEISDLFEEGKNYLGFDTAEEASAQVRRLLQDPALARSISANSLHIVREKHTFASRVDQILDGAPERETKTITVVSETLNAAFLMERGGRLLDSTQLSRRTLHQVTSTPKPPHEVNLAGAPVTRSSPESRSAKFIALGKVGGRTIIRLVGFWVLVFSRMLRLVFRCLSPSVSNSRRKQELLHIARLNHHMISVAVQTLRAVNDDLTNRDHLLVQYSKASSIARAEQKETNA